MKKLRESCVKSLKLNRKSYSFYRGASQALEGQHHDAGQENQEREEGSGTGWANHEEMVIAEDLAVEILHVPQ